MVRNNDTQREFLCDKCHQFKFIDLPPADGYTNFLVNRCCEKSIERFYDCENCNHRNIRYWCYSHPFIASAGINVNDALDDVYDYGSSSLY